MFRRVHPNFLSCGFPKIAPPPLMSLASCPASLSRRGVRFGSTLPSAELLPPLPFFPTLVVCSACDRAGLFRPAPGHGVRAVSLAASLNSVFPRTSVLRALLTLAFIPFKAFPSSTAAPRHRVALPSRRSLPRPFPAVFCATSGPCSIDESVAARCVSAPHGPMLSWAWFLFKVLPSF